MGGRVDVMAGPRTVEGMIRGCAGKRQHKTFESALEGKRRGEAKRGVALRIYRCDLCLNWHLTSMSAGAAVRCGRCLEQFVPVTFGQWQCVACARGEKS